MTRALLVSLLFLYPLVGAEKRPLTHNDYDSWKHIQDQRLSNDGRYLAYAVFPQQGDGELIVRDLKTGKEFRQPIGELPPPPPPNYGNPQSEDAPPVTPHVTIRFTPDSTAVVFSTFPTHDATETAKRAKTKAENMPKGDVVVIKLPSGEPFRASSVKNFQLPLKASGVVAYLQVAPSKPENPKPADAEPDSATPKKKIEIGDLVLRDITKGTERKFPTVAEYSLTDDGKLLLFATSANQPEQSGVFSLSATDNKEPITLLAGKGKYQKLTWNEEQTRLAFVSDRDDAASPVPEFKLYTWARQDPTASEIVSSKTPNLPSNWVVSETAAITLSKSGDRIFFGAAPKHPAPPPPDKTPADEKVSVDLWSWRDDYIQPMQKVRAEFERTRSYRTEFDVAEKRLIPIADLSMPDATLSEDGRYAIGLDDRAYRREQEFDTHYDDVYVVDASTGARTLAVKKSPAHFTWSPDGKYAVFYNGKDWLTVAASSGSITNLTAKLSVSFGREDFDMPEAPVAYGLAGWTRDGRSVLIYDRFDIWRLSPDGSSSVKLTDGRKDHIAYRLVRFNYNEPSDRWIDPEKPLLLRAENDDSHETGFISASLSSGLGTAKPKLETKNFAPPIKARDAEVYVTAASTFREFPDLLVTDAKFHSFEKVSDANPQMAGIAWGSAELIPYKSADGIPLQAILYKPADFDPQKKYPMIVYLYERLTQSIYNFVEPRPGHTINPSYYTSNGYLVLEPDIAYKIGYPGQSALHCVLSAVQAAVDRGFVNEQAIGIQGHSWGGYQIAYMVTQTNRFRAAAPGAPVADMISAYDGIRWGPGIPRQFQYERSQSRIGGTPWEYPLRFIENSPIFMVDRVKTPLLMIHNDADDAVPWYQGIEFYLALRRLGKEVYLFTYNGEPHGLRRRVNQKDYTVRLQQFFDYELKGAPKPEWMETGIPFIDKQTTADKSTK